MFVDGTTPTEEDLDVALALDPAQAHHYSNLAFGLLGRVVAARSGHAVHGVRRRADHRSARARADDLALAGAEGAGLPRRRVRAHRLDRAGDRPRRRRRDGAALVDRRGSRRLGDVPRARRRRRARRGDDRGDVVPAGHVLPRRLGARLGARARCSTTRTGRSSAVTAARWRATSPVSSSTARRRSAPPRSRTRARAGTWSCSRSRSSRRRWSSGRSRSSRGGPRPIRPTTCARSSAAGGRRGTSSSSGGSTARCRRRSSARRPGGARRRSSATATAGAPSAGRERGERLRVEDGQLVWAGYPFTRAQEPFKA